jgi:hypothetical protein
MALKKIKGHDVHTSGNVMGSGLLCLFSGSWMDGFKFHLWNRFQAMYAPRLQTNHGTVTHVSVSALVLTFWTCISRMYCRFFASALLCDLQKVEQYKQNMLRNLIGWRNNVKQKWPNISRDVPGFQARIRGIFKHHIPRTAQQFKAGHCIGIEWNYNLLATRRVAEQLLSMSTSYVKVYLCFPHTMSEVFAVWEIFNSPQIKVGLPGCVLQMVKTSQGQKPVLSSLGFFSRFLCGIQACCNAVAFNGFLHMPEMLVLKQLVAKIMAPVIK